MGIFPLIVRFGELSPHGFALSTKYGVWDFWGALTLWHPSPTSAREAPHACLISPWSKAGCTVRTWLPKAECVGIFPCTLIVRFGYSNIVSASQLVYILLPTFYFQCKFSVAFIRFWLAPLPLLDGNFFSCSDFWMCVILRNFLMMEWQEPLSSLAAEYQSGSPILLEKIKVLCVLCIFLLLWLLFSL